MAERRRSRPIASCVVEGEYKSVPGGQVGRGRGIFETPSWWKKKRKNASGIRKARKARANRKNSRQHLHAHSTYLRRLLHLSRLLWTSLLTLVVVGCTCAWCHHHNPSSLLESLLLVEFFFFFLVSLVVAGVIIIRKIIKTSCLDNAIDRSTELESSSGPNHH